MFEKLYFYVYWNSFAVILFLIWTNIYILFQKLPAPKAKRTPKKKPVGTKWRKENKFEPEPVVLYQPAYNPEKCDANWDDDTFISQYIDEDFLKITVDKTNQTYVHSNGKSLQLTLEEFKVWIGMVFVMSALQYPKIRMYGRKTTEFL